MSISRVSVHGLRGVDTPSPLELAPLNIIVGRNGVGKSTIIDGILIGASQSPADALGRVVRRRTGIVQGAPWVLSRTPNDDLAKAKVVVESDTGVTTSR